MDTEKFYFAYLPNREVSGVGSNPYQAHRDAAGSIRVNIEELPRKQMLAKIKSLRTARCSKDFFDAFQTYVEITSWEFRGGIAFRT